MARVLSALVLLPLVLGTIWFLPGWATLILAELIALFVLREFGALGAGFGARPMMAVTTLGVMATVATATQPLLVPVFAVTTLLVGTLSLARGDRDQQVLLDIGSALFPLLYVGVPLATLVALRASSGPEALLLLLATIMVSDTAQYYGGRTWGRTPLAPANRPNTPGAGAVCGVAGGVGLIVVFSEPALGVTAWSSRLMLGVVVVGLGIAGDLFESRLKRGAGVKDASSLIPGHGGMLDRVDSLLFAAPGFFFVFRLLSDS
ncbi:MAG: phosphatidate cytidylyltransferase [Acidobacteriota bacterium]|nr:phosphatidate cytidylyltransferase [Acidobacteriota bacterium]